MELGNGQSCLPTLKYVRLVRVNIPQFKMIARFQLRQGMGDRLGVWKDLFTMKRGFQRKV